MEDDLKRCPFCHGKPTIHFWIESYKDDIRDAVGEIECTECHVRMKHTLSFTLHTSKNPGETFIGLEKQLKTIWNSRVEDD